MKNPRKTAAVRGCAARDVRIRLDLSEYPAAPETRETYSIIHTADFIVQRKRWIFQLKSCRISKNIFR